MSSLKNLRSLPIRVSSSAKGIAESSTGEEKPDIYMPKGGARGKICGQIANSAHEWHIVKISKYDGI